ncbi:uncharacterized protein UV8b_04528 [Ustilaginoidea virens]|uniref:Uncharacterized protein n=1 Tax=Ustilaginoidea virens TaxID=1159556 RepID=A0A8E5MI79_USTVR|nr:uncharacterized protein UV8b_04528 [Ustilaginoidea virens]QUC20287.1 hypothetical protein UV8b_04528 [Ustilaginoidea virens]
MSNKEYNRQTPVKYVTRASSSLPNQQRQYTLCIKTPLKLPADGVLCVNMHCPLFAAGGLGRYTRAQTSFGAEETVFTDFFSVQEISDRRMTRNWTL